MGKKPIITVTYENERISIKNSLPYLCVLRLSCVDLRADLWPFYGFLCERFSLYKGLPPGFTFFKRERFTFL